jgi:hypothetical protein
MLHFPRSAQRETRLKVPGDDRGYGVLAFGRFVLKFFQRLHGCRSVLGRGRAHRFLKRAGGIWPAIPLYVFRRNALVEFRNEYLPPGYQCHSQLRSRPRYQSQDRPGCASGSKFVIAPPTMTELTVGVVKGGATWFAQNKVMFEWLKSQSANILDLPRPFMGKVLGFSSKKSDVDVGHHLQRIQFVIEASDFPDFLRRKDAPGSLWPDIETSAAVHEQQLDKEFAALQKLAKRGFGHGAPAPPAASAMVHLNPGSHSGNSTPPSGGTLVAR